MARTIMIANDLYGELKAIKGEASFTELIRGFVERARDVKLGKELNAFLGALKNDKEYDAVLKEARKGWATWSKKYV